MRDFKKYKVWEQVCRILSSYNGISKYFLTDRRSETAHSHSYVRISMMKSWRKRYRNTYRYLVFGALSHQVTLSMYKISQNFPKEEMLGITSQMRRAAYSIPSNIAEGCGRESDAEFKRFLVIAQGSSSELEYFAMLVKDLGYIDDSVYLELYDRINKVKRSLQKLIQKI